MMKNYKLIAGLLLSFDAFTAQAALLDRGAGLLYDTVLNVTWLADANYARTSLFDGDGLMNRGAANTWASTLVYHDSVRNTDYSGWRLARNSPVNESSYNYDTTNDGSSDVGYNITSAESELAYMYYVNLGLKGMFGTTGLRQTDYGIFGNGNTDGETSIGLVRNLQSFGYWSGLADWVFQTNYGNQASYTEEPELYAWAVRDGDIAAAMATPVPGSVWLLLSGTAALLGFKRRSLGVLTQA